MLLNKTHFVAYSYAKNFRLKTLTEHFLSSKEGNASPQTVCLARNAFVCGAAVWLTQPLASHWPVTAEQQEATAVVQCSIGPGCCFHTTVPHHDTHTIQREKYHLIWVTQQYTLEVHCLLQTNLLYFCTGDQYQRRILFCTKGCQNGHTLRWWKRLRHLILLRDTQYYSVSDNLNNSMPAFICTHNNWLLQLKGMSWQSCGGLALQR